jgi:hypothetical protein
MTSNKHEFYHIKDKKDFSVHLNEKVLFSQQNFNKEVTLINSHFNKEVPDSVNENAIVEIINRNFKGIAQIPDSYFHYFSDFVGPVFVFLENCIKHKIKKVQLILVELEEKQEIVREFTSFFEHCMDQFKDRIEVSWITVNQAPKNDGKSYLRVNNSTIIEQQDIGISLNFIYESAKSFASLSENTAPNKKVFLSRRKDYHKDKADSRHIYEKDAEEFFESIGFEVVNGEAFGSLKKQIEFFDQVSVFAGYTGSGLTSSIFMKPGQTLIEVICPIKFGKCGHDGGDEWEIHNFYKTFSVLKNHTYIAIPNVDRSKEDFLRDLEKVSKML